MLLPRGGGGSSSGRRGDRSGRGGGRGLLLVSVGVFDHPVLADESFAADITGEGLLASVEAHVPPKVRLVIELLRAHFALVWLVPSVFCKVLLQCEG